MRFDRQSKSFETIAAFEDGNETAVAVLGGEVGHEQGEIAKVVVGETKEAEWVTETGIETSGDEDQVGSEFFGAG